MERKELSVRHTMSDTATQVWI